MKFLIYFLIPLVFISCSKKNDITSSLVLKVNDTSLTAGEFSDQLISELKKFDLVFLKQKSFINDVKKKLVHRFIIKSITEKWAKKNNIFVKTIALDANILNIKKTYPDDIAFRRALSDEKISFSSWKKRIRYNMLQKLIQKKLNENIVKPTDSELKKYYYANKEQFKSGDARKLQQIVLQSEVDANLIYKKLRKKRKFEELVKFSITPESRKKGHLGWIEKGDSSIFDKVFKVRVGRLSPIIKSEYGFHIIKILRKRKARQIPLKQVKTKIRNIIYRNREQAIYSSWLDEQLRKSKVYKNNDIINNLFPDVRS